MCVPVEALLVVQDEGLHRGHFSLRSAPTGPQSATTRTSTRYARLQEHLAAGAREAGMPVIDNVSVEETLGSLMGLVLDAVGNVEERR